MSIPNTQALEEELKSIVNAYYDANHNPRQAAMHPFANGHTIGQVDLAENLLSKYFDYSTKVVTKSVGVKAEFNIIDSYGEVKFGPFSSEVAAHNKLRDMFQHAIEDECEGFSVQ
jgi:hypothetical protein